MKFAAPTPFAIRWSKLSVAVTMVWKRNESPSGTGWANDSPIASVATAGATIAGIPISQ